jgi:16S rRNA (cytosine1402-N4)-methyltransferase
MGFIMVDMASELYGPLIRGRLVFCFKVFGSRMNTVHVPVLLKEAIEGLQLNPGYVVVDGTLGGGGHTIPFAELVGPRGKVIGLDRDPSAVSRIETEIPSNVVAVASNYADTPEVLKQLEIEKVDAIFLDLGLSSDQLADEERGFSFQVDGPLDLRFNATQGEPAWRLVQTMKEKNLADLIYEYGEERHSRRIARKIVEVRERQSLKTSSELAELLRRCVPRSKNHSIDPATRTFQALRIAVNEELKWLKVALKRLPECLKPGGIFGLISFHSLEDRMVKHGLREDERMKVLTKKPVMAGEAELHQNPRARSAKMRFAQRI